MVSAQGRFSDARERPLRLRPGLAHLAEGDPDLCFLPLALEYTFWDEKRPEMLFAFGPPLRAGELSGLSARERLARLEERLTATLDDLSAAAMSRDAGRFSTFVSGAGGIDPIYDAWRRLKAAVARQSVHSRTWRARMIDRVLILLALIPASNTVLNLFVLRAPPRPTARPSLAILIPARDEAERIGACLDAALASEGVDFEVIVLDDNSTDDTAEIVRARAAADPRLRLASAPPLPPGWKGKTHACQVLASLTERPLLLFIDADVLLAPEAAARLAPAARSRSGQRRAAPDRLRPGRGRAGADDQLPHLRLSAGHADASATVWPATAVACGQLMMIRADAYAETGGHAAVADALHEGLKLARHFRERGPRHRFRAGRRSRDLPHV